MDWNCHGSFVFPTSHSEPEIVWKYRKGKIYTISYRPDSPCFLYFIDHDWFHGQRNHSFQTCPGVSANSWRAFPGTESAYALCLLGIYTDVFASGVSLEYDDGHGGQIDRKNLCGTDTEPSGTGFGDCSLWRVCVWKKGNRQLSVFEDSVCVF